MPKKTVYSVHPSIAMVQKWIDELPAKTGKSLEQWITLIKKKGPKTDAERREWLRKEHGFNGNAAWWLSDRSVGKGFEETPETYLIAAEKYVDTQYEKKAELKAIYDHVLKLGLALGKDVKACPCQTMVPLYRNNVFAQLKPSTKTRLDLGFCLRGVPFTERLIDTGGTAKKDRITHRVGLTSINDIDAEVKGWLRKAYDMDV